MLTTDTTWNDYELLDAGGREKLERWGKYILRRPDPQAIWDKNPKLENQWESADMVYERSPAGGGNWIVKGQRSVDQDKYNNFPDSWVITYKQMKFRIRPMGFKHTGIFPEQSVNWDFVQKELSTRRDAKVLNLFGYTGATTTAAMSAGAHVTHVDSSREIMDGLADNIELSGLDKNKVRYIVDDCLKFVKREVRRGAKYDAIIMDPPAFGRGSAGQVWKLEKDLPELLRECKDLLSDNPLLVILSVYANEFSPLAFANLMDESFKPVYTERTVLHMDEMAIEMKDRLKFLPAGACVRIVF